MVVIAYKAHFLAVFALSIALCVLPSGSEAQIVHSGLADTIGMENDLRIIEQRLGPLDASVRGKLMAVKVDYFTFDPNGTIHKNRPILASGVLIVHSCVAEEVKAIFAELLRDTFPIAKVVPINCYGLNADSTGWNDEASMADNNTSAFNYRKTPATRELSNHSRGIAIDINPLQNPQIRNGNDGRILKPVTGSYDPTRPGTLTWRYLAPILMKRNWSWGGRWPKPKDYQHIEKNRICVLTRSDIRSYNSFREPLFG